MGPLFSQGHCCYYVIHYTTLLACDQLRVYLLHVCHKPSPSLSLSLSLPPPLSLSHPTHPLFSVFSQDIMDPSKHFIKDDTIILQAKVEADAPHGIKLVIILHLLSLPVDINKNYMVVLYM